MKRFLASKFLAVAVLSLFVVAVWAFPCPAQQEQVVVKGERPSLILFSVNSREYAVRGYCPPSVKPSRVVGDTSFVRMDVTPEVVPPGRTFVPVRFLANALGVDDANISWDAREQRVVLAEPSFPRVEMKIGERWVSSDGQVRQIDVAPVIKPPGRTMLPARFVAEALGFEVDWLPDRQVVICWPRGKPKPAPEEVRQILDNLWTYVGPDGNKVAVPPGAEKMWDGPTGSRWDKDGVKIMVNDNGVVDIVSSTKDTIHGATWEQMLATLRQVLENTFGPGEFTDRLMHMAEQKDHSFKNYPPELMILTAPDGRQVMVDDNGSGIFIAVAPPGVTF